jgi:hypothetical protein
VFDYSDTIRAAETLFHSNQNPFTTEDRRFVFETSENDLDNFSEMMSGNDPRSYQLEPEPGPEPPEWNHGIKPADFDDKFGDFFAGESGDEDKDPAEPDSDSDSQEELESDQQTLLCTDKTPKSGHIVPRVLAMNGKTRAQAL